MSEAPKQRTLGPTVAGAWYPAERDELQRQVEALLESCPAPARVEGAGDHRTLAVVAPHAGFIYSGSVAAAGFRHLKRARYRRVILLGPSHFAAFAGAVVPSLGHYRTPLGRIELDTTTIAQLAAHRCVRIDDDPFYPEHCLEAELPFLQSSLEPGWRLVPLLLGSAGDPSHLDAVADALRPLIDTETLIVASSDFTHYGQSFHYVPFETDVAHRIRELDHGAIERILEGDSAGFEAYVSRTGATICGRGAIGVLLRVLPANREALLAAYDNSGRLTGTWDHSVSYASLIFREA
jgi:AmmeMemoRadiSam system protein B